MRIKNEHHSNFEDENLKSDKTKKATLGRFFYSLIGYAANGSCFLTIPKSAKMA